MREESYEILGFLQEVNSLGKSDFCLEIKYIFSDADKMEYLSVSGTVGTVVY